MNTIKQTFHIPTMTMMILCLICPVSRGNAESETLKGNPASKKVEQSMSACIAEASRLKLPIATLQARLQEALVKKVSDEKIVTALEHHLQALIAAQKILEKAAGRNRESRTTEILTALARAIESGLPPEIFEELFKDQRGVFSYRMQALIEAGEMLYLGGISQESVKIFMLECKNRDMPRKATIRAASFWMQRHQEGLDTDEILRRLWGGEVSRP